MCNFKRILSLLLSITMLFALCACGGEPASSEIEGAFVGFEDETASGVGAENENNSGVAGNVSLGDVSGTTVESKVEMSGSDPFANIPKRLKGTTVTFAHFGDEGGVEYQKVGKAFEKKTGIKIQWKTFNQAEYVAQVANQITGGASPDIIVCNGTFPFALEIAQPLENIIDLSDDFWDDSIVNMSTLGGHTYFVNSLESVWENTYMVFYNKQLFSANGLTTPTDYYSQGKWTYENFKKCMEDVVKAGYTGGYIDPNVMNTAMGNTMFSYDMNTRTFKSNADKTVPGYQFHAQCFKEGLWSTTAWWGTFASGDIGIYLSGIYGMKYNGYFKDCDDNMLVAVPLPTSYQGKATKQVMSFRGFGIAKGAKNPEGAAYFLRYYLDYANYDAAGADTFKNKSLEKVYFDTIVPLIRKEGCNFDFDTLSHNVLAQNLDTGVLEGIHRTDPAQVAALITSKKNTIQNIVDKANEKLAQYK